MEKSHGLYSESVRLLKEEDFLLNVVHIRYGEVPTELELSSIAMQFELTGTAEARPFFGTPNPAGSTFHTYPMILPDLQAGASNRPTITLLPADDGTSIRQFLTPISASTLVFLSQTSWPISTVLRLWVERINGVPNAAIASGPLRPGVVEFARFLRLMELLQIAQDDELAFVLPTERLIEVSGPLSAEQVTAQAAVEAAKEGMEYRPKEGGKSWVLVKRERKLVMRLNPGAENSPVMVEIMALSNLLPGQREYEIVLEAEGVPDPLRFPSGPRSVMHVVPRSTSQVYFFLANGVEVPGKHVEGGLVQLPLDAEGRPFDAREITRGLFEVHVCKGHKPPPTAFVSVHYRGYWYYINDRDQASKTTLALMLRLHRLDFGRQKPAAPLLTLPVGR
jgi:hypothetical protein